MAKMTPGLMGAKTTPTLGKDPIGGFVDKGANQLNAAIGRGIAQTNRNKAMKFQQAQQLRDGIVSGHFSDDMVVQVEAALDRMSKLNPNGQNYSKVLNEANAELGMTVQKQHQVTQLLDRTSKAFEGDEDKKYYNKEAFFALLEDKTDIDLTSTDMTKAYEGYLKTTDNINQDVVREDFVELLGKYKFGGSTQTKEGKIGEFTTMKTGQYQGEKTQMYKLENGVSVPLFEKAADVPEDLVEKWGTSSKAHMAMLDNYVNGKLKGQKFNSSEDKEKAEMLAGQEFVLDQMKKVIPDYASISSSTEKFQPGQGGGSGTGTKPNASSLIATQLSKAMLGDASMIGKTPVTTMNFENNEITGYDITDQFKDIKLIPGVGKGPGRRATRVFRAENEDALYIDNGSGITRYDESQFNDLMILASSAGNGFTMKEANALPEYDNTRKAFNIRQQMADADGNIKPLSELTPEERSSGNWSPANRSLTGTDFNPYVNNLTEKQKIEQKVRANQATAGSALGQIDGFEFNMMDDSNTNAEMMGEMADALNTSWSNKIIGAIHPTKTISSIKKGRVNVLGVGGAGGDKFVVRFTDGTDKVISQSTMRTYVQGQNVTD